MNFLKQEHWKNDLDKNEIAVLGTSEVVEKSYLLCIRTTAKIILVQNRSLSLSQHLLSTSKDFHQNNANSQNK